jgi:thiamine pyrophosphokinase
VASNPTYADKILVVAGGDPWTGPLPQFGSAITRVIAADSGVDLAVQLGLPVAVVIGDLDSASPEALADAEQSGARIERYPKDKDATDLELALDLACAEGASQIVVIGGGGGRISHFLGNAALLAASRFEPIRITWLLPGAEIYVVTSRHEATMAGTPGDLVSLVPMGGSAGGVTTSGLRWALDDDELAPSATRGISNEMVAEQADIKLSRGTVLAIHERQAS